MTGRSQGLQGSGESEAGKPGAGSVAGSATGAGAGHGGRKVACAVCGRMFPRGQTVALAELRPTLAAFAAESHPQLPSEGFICKTDLGRLRAGFVARLLERERGELSHLEREVVESLAANETLAEDVEKSFERQRTLGDRMADAIATFGGSWGFIGIFAGVLGIWILFNLIAAGRAQFDPYPFILLNLALSCLAAVQAPVIMMSQKRVEVRDRLRAENDFKVNLKAELEIRHLHEKLDHLLGQQWERLAQIQEVQIDLLEAMNERRK